MSELDEFWEEYVNRARPAGDKIMEMQMNRHARNDAMNLAGYNRISVLKDRVDYLETIVFQLLTRLYS